MMKVLALIVLLAVSAYAQKGGAQMGKILRPPKDKPSPPVRVNESDRSKRCPSGFQAVGKQCAQTVEVEAEVVCPSGTSQLDGKCAKFVGKHPVCPAGYSEDDGACLRLSHASPEVICPEGYVLTGKDECSKRVQGPPRAICPGGSIARGDQCVRKQAEAANYVCPNGYKQEGNRCMREETFDCTPPRKPNVRPTKGGGSSDKKGPATVEEYVLQSTCKRIFSEPARKVCENGKLEGKTCLVDVVVEPLIEPGKFREITVPASRQCPEGFSSDLGGKECLKTVFAAPQLVCPPKTSDLGDKCATFAPLKVECPKGFSLENDRQCVKTIFAAPIIEYSVTYECKGKNCAH